MAQAGLCESGRQWFEDGDLCADHAHRPDLLDKASYQVQGFGRFQRRGMTAVDEYQRLGFLPLDVQIGQQAGGDSPPNVVLWSNLQVRHPVVCETAVAVEIYQVRAFSAQEIEDFLTFIA